MASLPRPGADPSRSRALEHWRQRGSSTSTQQQRHCRILIYWHFASRHSAELRNKLLARTTSASSLPQGRVNLSCQRQV